MNARGHFPNEQAARKEKAADESGISRFVRQATTFVRNGDDSWRRDDETHHNVLVDTGHVPALLAAEGVQVKVARAFGTEPLPTGLHVLIGQRAP